MPKVCMSAPKHYMHTYIEYCAMEKKNCDKKIKLTYDVKCSHHTLGIYTPIILDSHICYHPTP
jgi:hypothetical protein